MGGQRRAKAGWWYQKEKELPSEPWTEGENAGTIVEVVITTLGKDSALLYEAQTSGTEYRQPLKWIWLTPVTSHHHISPHITTFHHISPDITAYHYHCLVFIAILFKAHKHRQHLDPEGPRHWEALPDKRLLHRGNSLNQSIFGLKTKTANQQVYYWVHETSRITLWLFPS